MRLTLLTYYFFSVALLLHGTISVAQLGAPVYIQDFGLGDANPSTIGPALPPGRTSFTYSTATCPPAGSYTVVRRMNIAGCFNDEWIPLSTNHTPGMDFGNLMLVNYTTNVTPKVVYIDTVTKPLCVGANYQFSVAIINVDKVAPCDPGPTFPVFALVVENISGQKLFSDTIHGGVPFSNGTMGYRFGVYGVSFTMPAGLNELVLRLVLLPSSADCGEDFAIDDVGLFPMGPEVRINFENEPAANIVKSVCFQDNRTITMTGVMDGYYTVPALQWQQSSDDGATWTDIPWGDKQ
jgi:hypothetical protein